MSSATTEVDAADPASVRVLARGDPGQAVGAVEHDPPVLRRAHPQPNHLPGRDLAECQDLAGLRELAVVHERPEVLVPELVVASQVPGPPLGEPIGARPNGNPPGLVVVADPV